MSSRGSPQAFCRKILSQVSLSETHLEHLRLLYTRYSSSSSSKSTDASISSFLSGLGLRGFMKLVQDMQLDDKIRGIDIYRAFSLGGVRSFEKTSLLNDENELCVALLLLVRILLPFSDKLEDQWKFIYERKIEPLIDRIKGGPSYHFLLPQKPSELSDAGLSNILSLYEPSLRKIFVHFSSMFDEKESVSENENNDTDVSKDMSKVPSSELESLSLDNDTEDEEDDEGDLMNWEEFSQFLEDFSLCPSLFDWKSARKIFESVNVGEVADENVSDFDFDEFREAVARIAFLIYTHPVYKSSHVTPTDKICALFSYLDTKYKDIFGLTMLQEADRAKRKEAEAEDIDARVALSEYKDDFDIDLRSTLGRDRYNNTLRNVTLRKIFRAFTNKESSFNTKYLGELEFFMVVHMGRLLPIQSPYENPNELYYQPWDPWLHEMFEENALATFESKQHFEYRHFVAAILRIAEWHLKNQPDKWTYESFARWTLRNRESSSSSRLGYETSIKIEHPSKLMETCEVFDGVVNQICVLFEENELRPPKKQHSILFSTILEHSLEAIRRRSHLSGSSSRSRKQKSLLALMNSSEAQIISSSPSLMNNMLSTNASKFGTLNRLSASKRKSIHFEASSSASKPEASSDVETKNMHGMGSPSDPVTRPVGQLQRGNASPILNVSQLEAARAKFSTREKSFQLPSFMRPHENQLDMSKAAHEESEIETEDDRYQPIRDENGKLIPRFILDRRKRVDPLANRYDFHRVSELSLITKRPYRELAIYNGPICVAEISDQPGRILTKNSLVEHLAEQHKFLTLRSLDFLFENILLRHLLVCDSFDEYLVRLLKAGFDFACPRTNARCVPYSELGRAWRLYRITDLRDDNGRVRGNEDLRCGFMLDSPGNFGLLKWQTTSDSAFSDLHTVTLYSPDDLSDEFFSIYHSFLKSKSWENMRKSLLECGIEIVSTIGGIADEAEGFK